MHRVAVTGTRGFLGRHLCQYLSKYFPEIEVIPLYSQDNIFITSPETISESPTLVLDKLNECSAVLLLGTHSSCQPYDTHIECAEQNIGMNLELLRLAHKVGIRKFLAIGTCFEFGLTANTEYFLHPLSRLLPIGSYPSSKAAFCLMSLDWAREMDVEFTYSRLFQVYGIGEHSSRLYPSLVRSAREGKDFILRQPQLVRDFMHVSQVVENVTQSLLFVLESKYKLYPRVEHICNGVGTSLNDFAHRIWSEEKATGNIIHLPSESLRKVDVPRIVGLSDNVIYS